MFEAELITNLTGTCVSRFSRQIYDAIWAMALTLMQAKEMHCSIFLQDFEYTRKDMVQKFTYYMSKLKFMGVSVSIYSYN